MYLKYIKIQLIIYGEETSGISLEEYLLEFNKVLRTYEDNHSLLRIINKGTLPNDTLNKFRKDIRSFLERFGECIKDKSYTSLNTGNVNDVLLDEIVTFFTKLKKKNDKKTALWKNNIEENKENDFELPF